MTKQNRVLAAEDRFFDALLDGNGEALRAVLTPDFVLIDVMTGSEIPGSVLVDLVGGGQLVFEAVERIDQAYLTPAPGPPLRYLTDRSIMSILAPMPRPKSFDEDAVLAQAVELFRARGYEGTSLADLETHLGLGRQSLYNTFGDKQTLFLKALDHYRRNQGESMVDPLSRPDAGMEAIREFFRTMVRGLTGETPRRGCLVANTITERGSDDAASLRRCNLSREQLARGFRRALGQARDRGELPPHVDVDATATLLVIQNYGLSSLAKTGASLEELEAATEALLAGLE
jgi:TetR/AcrR family transcriptional repressor of nem operon